MEASLWSRVRGWAAPPKFADDEKDRVAGLLHYFLLAIIVGALLSTITTALRGVAPIRALFPLVIVLISLVSFALMRQGWVRLSAFLFTGSLWVITTISVGTGAGIRSSSFSFYVLTIILAAVLLDEHESLLFTSLSMISALVMTYLDIMGLFQQSLPSTEDTPVSALAFYGTLILAAGTVLYMTGRSIRSAFIRVRSSEQALTEHNRKLEQQITERLRAEAERKGLFELSLDLMAVFSLDGRFNRLNPAFTTMLGYTEQEMLGKPLSDFVHPDDRGMLQTMFGQLVARVEITDFEFRCLHKEGQAHLLSWNARPIGEVVYAVGRDMTARRQVEQNQMQLALAVEKASFLTDFLATVSHDIKTPLTVINASLYLLEHLPDPARQHDKIRQIKEQTQVVERFVQDILTVSRLEYQSNLNLQPINLAELLSVVVGRLLPKADHKRIQIHVDAAQAIPSISADYDQIERVFTNLIENALNYTPDQGRVEVRMLAENDEILVDVTDTGVGIQEKDLPRIFEHYFRGEEARRLDKGGSGLGLAIVKKILDMHRGTVEVSSKPHQGTTFRVHLPTSQPATKALASPAR